MWPAEVTNQTSPSQRGHAHLFCPKKKNVVLEMLHIHRIKKKTNIFGETQ